MERPLAGDLPMPVARVPVRIAVLAPEDVPALAALRPVPDPAALRERLGRGHQCFAVWREGRIVHAGWAASRDARIEFLDVALPLEPGDVYQYDSYTTPDARGLGIAAQRVGWMARHFQAQGARRLLAVVWPGNPAAFRPLEKAGYRRAGAIHALRLGRWRPIFHTRTRSR
jgi:GNAT superfamily N-acetyltransferase